MSDVADVILADRCCRCNNGAYRGEKEEGTARQGKARQRRVRIKRLLEAAVWRDAALVYNETQARLSALAGMGGDLTRRVGCGQPESR